MTSTRATRALLVFAAFATAGCGFAYELVIVTLGSHLVGSSTTQLSVVLGVFVAAMGVGSLLAKPLLGRPAAALAGVQIVVALAGGLSAVALYASFAWLDVYEGATIAFAALVGTLVGTELPLLVTLLQRARPEAAGRSASDLLAADYAGALVAGLAFPFLLLPALGQLQTAIALGALNAALGVLILWRFRSDLSRRATGALLGGFGFVTAILGVSALRVDDIEVSARQALYEDPIISSADTAYQGIVVTRSLDGRDLRLFLNGDLQFSSIDEYRYHEALVHPAMVGRRERVLVLGGGDGMALREVLAYPDVREVVLVELDPEVLRLAREDDRLRRLNRRSLSDPRVTVVADDAFAWLRRASERFDVLVADFPDPDDTAVAKLYSVELYTLARRHLAPDGRLVVQAGSPAFAPDAYWGIEASIRAAGLRSVPYHVDVPSFGDWGFHLASRAAPRLDLDVPTPLRSLDGASLRAAATFPPDRGRRAVEPSTLARPRIVDYARNGWRDT